MATRVQTVAFQGIDAVLVNGQVETRRGRKLHDGDVVVVEGEELVVQVTEGET